MSGKVIGYGKNGCYLGSSRSVAWNDIYRAMVTALVQREEIETGKVHLVDDAAQAGIGEALTGPKDMAPLFLSVKCILEA
jgi:hypothetical protein